MLSTALLLSLMAHPALADTFEVSVEYEGAAASWTIDDARGGEAMAETMDLSGRSSLDIVLDYEVQDDGVLKLSAEAYEVRDRLLRGDTRTVITRPILLVRDCEPAAFIAGWGIEIRDGKPVVKEGDRVFTLRITPLVSGHTG